jgi:UrcA family protein
MSTFVTPRTAGSRTKVALLMLAGGLGCALGAGAASAAAADSDVPTVVVRYTAESLATDSGVQALYRKLVTASVRVCPKQEGIFWVTDAVRSCRQQAIARAVEHINNPHLAALYATSSKSG